MCLYKAFMLAKERKESYRHPGTVVVVSSMDRGTGGFLYGLCLSGCGPARSPLSGSCVSGLWLS